VNFAFGAIGAFDGSCATSAATYASAVLSRQARSHAAPCADAVDAIVNADANATASVITLFIMTFYFAL
jgi:hypothetical protein